MNEGGGLPTGLNILGLAVGATGILWLIPGLTDLLTGVFGLSQIIWFVWLGIVLLRSKLSGIMIAHVQEGFASASSHESTAIVDHLQACYQAVCDSRRPPPRTPLKKPFVSGAKIDNILASLL